LLSQTIMIAAAAPMPAATYPTDQRGRSNKSRSTAAVADLVHVPGIVHLRQLRVRRRNRHPAVPALPGGDPLHLRLEPVWSNLKRSLANLTKHDISQLTALIKTRLRRMQYRPGLLDGFLAKTGLDLPLP
jgi:hypothetical protein